MDTKALLAATILSVFFLGAVGAASIAYAQYMGGVEGVHELSIHQKGIQERTIWNQDRGLSYLDAAGVVGASVMVGAVFGGVAGAFFLRGRSGKYAAMGSG